MGKLPRILPIFIISWFLKISQYNWQSWIHIRAAIVCFNPFRLGEGASVKSKVVKVFKRWSYAHQAKQSLPVWAKMHKFNNLHNLLTDKCILHLCIEGLSNSGIWWSSDLWQKAASHSFIIFVLIFPPENNQENNIKIQIHKIFTNSSKLLEFMLKWSISKLNKMFIFVIQ